MNRQKQSRSGAAGGARGRPWPTPWSVVAGRADVRPLVGRSIGLSLFAIRPHGRPVRLHLEIVDPDQEGFGRVVVTNLTRKTHPILRYDTGDVGRVGESFVDGRMESVLEFRIAPTGD